MPATAGKTTEVIQRRDEPEQRRGYKGGHDNSPYPFAVIVGDNKPLADRPARSYKPVKRKGNPHYRRDDHCLWRPARKE